MVDSSSLIDQLLPADILKSIYHKLDFIDLVQCGAVSSHWNSLVEDLLTSSTPCLLLPSKELGDVNNNGYSCIYRLGDRQVSNLKRIPREFSESCCIGSSNGWLFFLEDHAIPSLFHPFKQVKIQLPSLLLALGLKRLEKNFQGDYEVEYVGTISTVYNYNKQELWKYFINKVLLIGEPDGNSENFGHFVVVMLCNYGWYEGSEIAYYRSGVSSWEWRISNSQDVAQHGNNLIVLTNGGTNIEVWGLEDTFMSARTNFVIQFPPSLSGMENFRMIYGRSYLIESCEDILLVLKFRAILNAKAVILFKLYKFDTDNNQWMEMKSLHNRVLFLDRNQASIQYFLNWENNSIYYTDEYVDKIGEEDYMYGFHYTGVYNLNDGGVIGMADFSTAKFVPPPYWIVPTHSKSSATPSPDKS